MVASHMPPTGDLACNPGMCPDWELNQRPFGSQACAQPTELHQPGLKIIKCFLKIKSYGASIRWNAHAGVKNEKVLYSPPCFCTSSSQMCRYTYCVTEDSLQGVRAATRKRLEENIGINLHDLGLSAGFLDRTPKVRATEQIDKSDFVNMKNFCAPVDTIKKMKMQWTDCKKIPANHISHKVLVSRIYKEPL